MAVDLEALQLREIEREGQFTPIQFGDIARGAIGAGQQFEASQDVSRKRQEAAQLQKILNAGDGAIIQIFNQLPDDEKKQVFHGNQNLMQSILKGEDGKVNVLKVIAEVQARKAGASASTFGEKAAAFGRGGLISGKEELSFQKPTAGKSGISNEVAAKFDKTVNDRINAFIAENGRDPNKLEGLKIINQVGIEQGIRADDPVRKVIADKFVTASAIATPTIQIEKFEEEKKVRVNTAVRKMGAKFTSKKREVVIAANELNRAITGGVHGDKFKNLISDDFLDGLKERLQLSEDSPTVIATIINAFAKGKLKDATEAKRVRAIKADKKFGVLFKDPEFNKVMVSLATLMTKVLRLESGAAITNTDIEDKKNNFGFDAIGTPGSFLIGIGNFMEGLRADILQIRKDEPDPEAKELFTKGFEGSGLASPFNLPERPKPVNLQSLKSELSILEAKAAE